MIRGALYSTRYDVVVARVAWDRDHNAPEPTVLTVPGSDRMLRWIKWLFVV